MSTSTCRTAVKRRLQHTLNESLGLLRVKTQMHPYLRTEEKSSCYKTSITCCNTLDSVRWNLRIN